ncbi:ribonuclease III [Pelagibacteraceae bacterium]|jgi:ribonuclease-3|nr:ribonuclease III [Pelagibacteraceae bacterium]MDC3263146.1 ribonuclease III [Pelagibacterales bacterium]|tara:strand:+ start:8568 stop:9236 length:669 start_codon:yes stop_codon:yes gene_type:complete
MKIEFLEKKISYIFENKNIIKRALTHKSTGLSEHNEQYEFLGDRVLGLIISEILILKYIDLSEGNLDKIFSTLVNKDKCAEVATHIGLGEYLILGKTEIASEGKYKSGILADACEALIASIYLDGGYSAAQDFINNNWLKSINSIDINFKDPKSALQEWSLKKYKKLPDYKVAKQEGPAHSPTFTVKVQFNDYKVAEAVSGNIKEAEKKAAIEFININSLEI